MELCKDPEYGPFVFLILDHFRRADIAWMLRDAERQPSPYEGWLLFRTAHRIMLPVLATSNAHIYFRFAVDDEFEWNRLSELEERAYGCMLAFSYTANKVMIYRDRGVECIVRDIRSIWGRSYVPGMDEALARDVADIAKMVAVKRNWRAGSLQDPNSAESKLPVSSDQDDIAPERNGPRGGCRERLISRELILGTRFFLNHKVFKKTQMITKRGRPVGRMARPSDGQLLNPQLLQERFKGEAASARYLQVIFMSSNSK